MVVTGSSSLGPQPGGPADPRRTVRRGRPPCYRRPTRPATPSGPTGRKSSPRRYNRFHAPPSPDAADTAWRRDGRTGRGPRGRGPRRACGPWSTPSWATPSSTWAWCGGVDVDGGDVVVDVALTIAACPLRTQIERTWSSHVRPWTGCARSRCGWPTMDADERAAVMARARWKAREDAPETAVPAPHPGAGHRLGQGWRRQVVGHGQPGRGPGRPGPRPSASSTPTSGASRSPGCSAWRATSRRGRGRWSRSSAPSARARCGCCPWGSWPTRSRPSCGAGWS